MQNLAFTGLIYSSAIIASGMAKMILALTSFMPAIILRLLLITLVQALSICIVKQNQMIIDV